MEKLTLNIGYDSPGLDFGTSKDRLKKTTYGQTKRSKQKSVKTDSADDDEEDNEVFFRHRHKKSKDGDPKSSQTQHISSLFASNPEIPVVESKEINPVKEDVFSKDLFEDFGALHPFMIKNLEDSFGVTKVTSVQKLALPVLLDGSDALVRSQTGSGKTLAYAIPIVEALHRVRPKMSRTDGIKAVVVLPTRELALQTYECFVKLIKSFTWLVPGLVVGGEKRKSEKARLRKGINILVGTPGRINDHAQNTKSVRLDQVEWLVLDEADRLLDLGYEKEITSLVKALNVESSDSEERKRRQTVLLSATLSAAVERLAGLTLSSPVRLDASQAAESDLVIPQSLKQNYLVTPAKLRLVTLAAFIHWKCKVGKEGKMLVFMATQDMVDYHTELLNTVLTGTAEFLRLHGSMNQHDRTQVFQTFKNAESGVLLCTDVAARGLDLPSVDWIVQYTAPSTAADYVHRVGRTARVGHTGSAMLFLVPSETAFISQLQEKRLRLKEEEMYRCLYNLQSLKWEDDTNVTSGVEGAATTLQLRFETAVLEQTNLHTLACKAYISWVRFYATYPRETREAFNFKELHLGHFAKSFALRDPPSNIGGIGRPNFKQDNSQRRFGGRAGSGQGRMMGWREREYQPKAPPKLKAEVSEFSSGLEPLKKKRKTAS